MRVSSCRDSFAYYQSYQIDNIYKLMQFAIIGLNDTEYIILFKIDISLKVN